MTVTAIAAGGACAATGLTAWGVLALWDGHRDPGPPFPAHVPGPGAQAATATAASGDQYDAVTHATTCGEPATRAGGPHRILTWYRHTRYQRRGIDAPAELQAATARLNARCGAFFPEVPAACRVAAFMMAVLATQPYRLYDEAAWDDYVKGAA